MSQFIEPQPFQSHPDTLSRSELRKRLRQNRRDRGGGTPVDLVRARPERERRQREAEQIILNDPFVQQMQREFGAKIVPGSIKPVDRH